MSIISSTIVVGLAACEADCPTEGRAIDKLGLERPLSNFDREVMKADLSPLRSQPGHID